ncbi:Receptor-interacting serine/threonine-protein kinase 1 [Hypsizygus marmoreus]|uniref:Receptor-interacting serine/threonine-protein kinase 1 n=1 Tax=Hypsizygus marmoreus TaxID=39966 RepID=A0A369K5R0_HYPMA|nr:Receptor-interacting serine/threonine-protein kinase 1 [Hypsizygus marmoreus]
MEYCRLPLYDDYDDDTHHVDHLYHLLQEFRSQIIPEVFIDYWIHFVDIAQRSSKLPSKFSVNRSDTIEKSIIGMGATATVYRSFDGEKAVAIKEFHVCRKTYSVVRKNYIKEALIMDLINHKHIVSFCGVIETSSKFSIVMPFMRNGDLCQFLAKTQSARRKLVTQIAQGLQHLKHCGVVHGDLKGSNILVDDDENACIADFGLAMFRTEHHYELDLAHASAEFGGFQGSDAGTLRYMSPERLSPETKSARATFASDVFSFGMVIYEVYSGRRPFHAVNDKMAIIEIVHNKRPERDFAIPDDLWSLAEECWHAEASHRPHIDDIVARLLNA